MPSYSGVWTLTAQYQAIGGQNWPMAPGAPTSVSATAGDTQATVTFVAPTFTGIPPGVTGYLATSTPGSLTATGASSPLTVTGLSNGTAYTIAVQATNGVQYGPAGTSGSVTPQAVFVVFAGGTASGGSSNVMSYVNIATISNATDFGDLTTISSSCSGLASTTRGVFATINDTTPSNVLEYITIATAGNATDFGDLLTVYAGGQGTCNSSTRGIINPEGNTINYITIASTGNAIDFGDKTTSASYVASCSSSTRGLFGGGTPDTNVIDYITIASVGNAIDFGDLIAKRYYIASCSNSTRGLFAGGSPGVGSNVNIIEYVTIATTGNTTDFGDLITGLTWGSAGAASSTRGLFAGGYVSANINVIQYVTIASTSNSIDFGDLTVSVRFPGSCSNGNGGVQ